MAGMYYWHCGCGLDGRGEGNARKHAGDCPEMGGPQSQPSTVDRTVAEEYASPRWAPIVERFWGYVDLGESGACWPWTGSHNPAGYGQVSICRKSISAHRVSYLIEYGSWPATILHSCDNPPCVNPNHLKGGTQAENMADMWAKGRRPKAITPELGWHIFQLEAQGLNHCEIARKIGTVSRTSVWEFLTRACRVTTGLDNSDHRPTRPCGEPTVAGALCRRHAEDRERLA